MIKDSTLATIEKNHGQGSMYRMGDAPIEDIDVIPSGSIALDLALGVGGYARGRVVEAYGPESSGKTTLALHAVAEAQKLGLECGFIDAEHALDPRYASNIGVDVPNLYISQPDHGEQALGIVLDCCKSGEFGLLIVDSVAALVPRAELAGDIGDAHVGLQARLMSQALRKIVGIAERTNTTVFFINQLREKIGVMFGSPETTPGGRALKFYASQRLDIRRKEQIKDGVEIIGNKTKVKVVKNKVAPPFTEVELEIYYGEGISTENSLLDVGSEYEVLRKAGSYWYMQYGGEEITLGNSKNAARLTLKDDAAMVDDLYNQITEAINGEGNDGDI